MQYPFFERPKALTVLAIACLLEGCTPSSSVKPTREWIDSTSHSEAAPDWTRDARVSWSDEKTGKHELFKSTTTVEGDHRVTACLALARLQAQERVLSQIFSRVKALITEADEGLSESADRVLSQVRTSFSKADLSGLRSREEYFERYRIGDHERIDCFVLSEINRSDLDKTRARVLKDASNADPRIQEAVREGSLKVLRESAAETSEKN